MSGWETMKDTWKWKKNQLFGGLDLDTPHNHGHHHRHHHHHNHNNDQDHNDQQQQHYTKVMNCDIRKCLHLVKHESQIPYPT